MSSGATAGGVTHAAVSNAALFFRRWLANPLQMGSVVPSSPALCRRIAALVSRGPDEAVLELGAGPGVVSRALLDAGVPPERLMVVEIMPDMADHLRRALPGVQVLCGDAFDLRRILPERWHGRVGTAICGIPLVLLPIAEQKRFIGAVEAVAPGRGLLLYTYCITSPLPYRKLGLAAGARRGRLGTCRQRVSGATGTTTFEPILEAGPWRRARFRGDHRGCHATKGSAAEVAQRRGHAP